MMVGAVAQVVTECTKIKKNKTTRNGDKSRLQIWILKFKRKMCIWNNGIYSIQLIDMCFSHFFFSIAPRLNLNEKISHVSRSVFSGDNHFTRWNKLMTLNNDPINSFFVSYLNQSLPIRFNIIETSALFPKELNSCYHGHNRFSISSQ